ncbi:MAG: RNA-binding protein [Candidatus Aenigmarchaeota archaeon]|nr:RNA-binding protein [Candidatus Aenigmarchaeota archaeon]
MAERIVCTSCRTAIVNVAGAARFKCPNCGQIEIVRCAHCRKAATHYTCSNCKFEGPN